MTDIAIFLMDLGGGGAERVMINLAQGFAQRQKSVDLVLVKAEGPYLSQLHPQINVVKLESSRLISSLPRLINYLKEKQPKVLFSALEDTNFVALLAKKLAGVSTKVAVTVHNHLSREAENATQLKRRLTPQLVGWFYPWADYVIAVSQGVADNLIQLGVPAHKVQSIYNPIITPELLQNLHNRVDHPWFAPNQPPVILGVGRLHAQKDFRTLILAFAQLRQQQPARLIILGEGEERSALQSLIQTLGLETDVALLGFVSNPYAYMAASAILVLSSAWEGFGNVLVEAMAAGTPVVSTNCDSGPSEILAAGRYGQLVTVGDPQAMATAIASTLATPPDSQMLRERAQIFSLENALDQYQHLCI
ncbi:Glycosyl transferase, group 1 [Planktothrix sp. PCC 11201]|uniref:glycosyltransferase n=1 Tax=Planktothrix sp. PCC 11201 TaxID=1729650 RepID=UPI0009110BF6|nr:glycosyltransferase [Planktothrix sp. PCC 11201]SKB16029.1 Glycosyl transferase, group 1 [Planktothrix sp. PCC 11201]